jgi:hypothetical protein
MYSRDIFPKYTSGGMPIPENYSGNAIRRAGSGGSVSPPTPAPKFSPRVHAAVERPTGKESAPPSVMSPSAAVDEVMPPAPAPMVEEKSEERDEKPEAKPAVAEEREAEKERRDGGIGSLLQTLLPPRLGGGGASQVGLEEALLLGLFLMLSQSEEEDDTLMLLALLFLYR